MHLTAECCIVHVAGTQPDAERARPLLGVTGYVLVHGHGRVDPTPLQEQRADGRAWGGDVISAHNVTNV